MTLKRLHAPFRLSDVLDANIADMTLKKTERTEFRLMKSVAELLSDRPLSQIRNIDISKHAGVSYGVVNLRFNDKFELVRRLVNYYFTQFNLEFDRHIEAQGGEEDVYLRLYDTVDYLIGCCRNNLGITRMLLVESNQTPQLRDQSKKTMLHWNDRLAELIPVRIGGKRFTKEDKHAMGIVLGGMLDDSIRQFYLVKDPIAHCKPKKLAEIITILRYRAIFGEDPSPGSVKRARLLAKRKDSH